MNVVVRHRIMRFEDFLAWEARQEVKYEFDGFEPVAMAEGSINHGRVQRNLAIAAGSRLRGSRCEFLGSDMKVVAANRSRYPDGQIICGLGDGDASFTTSPVVLFEVVTPGDERRDRVEKVAEYLRIASVQVYVILERDAARATVMTKVGEAWQVEEIAAGATIALPGLGIELPMAELYDGVAGPG